MAQTFYRPIAVDHTKVPNTDQTNFPVVISGTFSWAASIANGGRAVNGNSGFDLRPYSDFGLTTPLTYQLRNYDPVTGKFSMVVKVPTLSHTADTVFYIGMGDAALNTDGSSTGVWDANFKAVYPMGDGSALSLADATVNANTLTNTGAVTAAAGVAAGMGAASFNGTTQSLTAAVAPVVIEPYTLEALFNPADNTLSGELVSLAASANTTSTRALQKRLNNGTFNPMRAARSGVNLDQSSATGAYTASAWNYGAATSSGSADNNIHPNGAAKTNSATNLAATSNANRLGIGARNANGVINNFFTGLIGEVRVSAVVRADDWIVTTKNNLVGIASFYAVGNEAAAGQASATVSTQPKAKVVAGVAMASVVVTSSDNTFVGAVTASFGSGAGSVGGTVTVNAVAGVATFSNLILTGAGNHTLRFSSSNFAAVDSNVFLLGTDGSWQTRIVQTLITANSDSVADTISWNGIAWATNNTQSNLPVVTDGSGNVAAGEAYITLSGVDYPMTNWDGGGTFILTGAPHVSGVTFSYKYKRRYQFFLPGTLNQVSAPYGLLIWHGGGNSKGKDGVSQMSQAGELPYNIGWPNTGVPNTLTTGIFGTYNWPVATAFIQLAVGNFAAYEGRQLVDAIIADVKANFSIDATRLYWAGSSYGGYLGLAYVAANASKFAGIILTSAVTGQFYFAKFALGYVGANAAAARAYAAPLLAAAKVWFREITGTLDTTITAADDLTNNVPFDTTAYNAAYAAAGLTSGNERTSDVNIVQDYAPYGGTPWDHIAAYTNSLDETTLFSDMFARTQPLAGPASASSYRSPHLALTVGI